VLEPKSVEATVVPPTTAQSPVGLLVRTEKLSGATYKLRWPDSEHAFYVTINDVEAGGIRRPFEIFINSKNLEHYAWVVALTRMISAVFRRGGDVSFVADELKQVFDPRVGQWADRRYVPSLVAAIGEILERPHDRYRVPAICGLGSNTETPRQRSYFPQLAPRAALPEMLPARPDQRSRLRHLRPLRVVKMQLMKNETATAESCLTKRAALGADSKSIHERGAPLTAPRSRITQQGHAVAMVPRESNCPFSKH
jgi:hypothetical protein